MVFSATSRVTFLGTVSAEGLRVAAKESVVPGKVGVAVEESMGRLHDNHDVKLVIYLQYRFRVYSRDPHMHTTFSKQANPDDVAGLVLLYTCSLTVAVPSPFWEMSESK